MGVLVRAIHYKEKWAIVAPSEDKARIIMDYIIDHIFDDPMFEDALEFRDTKERLKQHRQKTRLSFRGAGEVRVYSADARNTKATRKALMGFGAANVILDESALIPDELYATVKRMLGGSVDNFLMEIGNPFYRNHFLRTWNSKLYRHIFIDVYMALAEGRYSPEYIEEMKQEAMFDVLYECRFPEADEILSNGYRRLINDSGIDNALVEALPEFNYLLDEEGNRKKNKWGFDIVDDLPVLGIDPAGSGSNQTAFVIRWPKHKVAMVMKQSDDEDPNNQAEDAIALIRENNISDYRIGVDAGGVGHGLAHILEAKGILLQKVLFGEKAAASKGFANIKAWLFWEARKWLLSEGGQLVRHSGFEELKLINYKSNSSLKLQIEPKEDMLKRLSAEGTRVSSPDTADAFALTFVDTSAIVEEGDIDFD